MSRRIIARDVNNATPTSYDISLWVDRKRLQGGEEATGVPTDFSLYILGEVNGVPCPGFPDVGWEIMDYDHNAVNPLLHKYIRSGVVVFPTETPIPGAKWIEVKVETGYGRQLGTPVPGMIFDESTYPNDALRAAGAIDKAVAEFGLVGTWDTVSQVESAGFVTYEPDSSTPYNATNVYEMLDAISTDPGRTTDAGYPVPKRFWYVSGEWVDPGNPLTSDILRVFHYYSSTQLGREPVPLTDRSDGMAYYSFDPFTRNTQSGSIMGVAETGQTWSSLVGTWGINGPIGGTGTEAYLATNVGQNVAVIEGSIADGEVSVVLSVAGTGPGIALRVVSNPSWSYKWEGFVFYYTGTAYRFARYQAGVLTTLATYTMAAADGDVLKVVSKGSSYDLYVNGVLKGTVMDTFNQTATLSGLYANPAIAGSPRWDDFGVWAKGARYWNISWPRDASGMTNIISIKGPGSEPEPVSWSSDDGVGVQGESDGDLTKTLKAEAWQASHVYSVDDITTSTTMDGHYRQVEGSGGTSGAGEPAWNTTEGGTTTDNGLTWRTKSWNAGSHSEQVLTDDGGYVEGRASQVRKVQDGFDRADNTAVIGKAPSGQDWGVLGAGTPVFGIRAGQAYSVSGTGARYAVIDSEVATAIVEVTFPTVVVGQRLAFRVRDINNLWYLEQQAAAYKLYKRAAGSDTLMGTFTTTPAAGDVLKVSGEDASIKVYCNAAGPVITVTDAFNLGATQHGIGTGSSSSATFDDFSVWQTYSSMALGIGAGTSVKSYADIDFGWVLDAATRLAQPVESGVLQGAPVTFSADDRFGVQVMPVVQPGALRVQEVRYFYNGVDVRRSTVHPTVTEAAPFYAQGSIYHAGATASDVTIQRYTYGIYQDDDSVAANGPWPLPTTLARDDLDTDAKRSAYKDAFFSRHAQPTTPVQLETLQEYHQGRLVLINNSRFGWQNKLPVLVSVQPDWSENLQRPAYRLVLGDSVEEWGDDEAAGYLLKNVLNSGATPPIPTGFGQSQGGSDGRNTVYHNFVWDRPRSSERWMEIQLRPLGGQAMEPVRLPASGGAGRIGLLPPSIPMTARIRSVSYSNRRSAWSAPIDLVTADIRPWPPTNLHTDTATGENGYIYTVDGTASWAFAFTPPVDGDGNPAPPDGYLLQLTRDIGSDPHPLPQPIQLWLPGWATGGLVPNLIVGSTYTDIMLIALTDGFPSDAATMSPITVPDATPVPPTVAYISQGHEQAGYYIIVEVDHATLTNIYDGWAKARATGRGGFDHLVSLMGAVPLHAGTGVALPVRAKFTGLALGTTYDLSAQVANEWGLMSDFSTPIQHTITPVAVKQPPNSWSENSADDPFAGYNPVSPAVDADFAVDASVAAFEGTSSLKMIVPASTNKVIVSEDYIVQPGERLTITAAVKRGSGTGTSPTAKVIGRWFDALGTTQKGSDQLVINGTAGTSWPPAPSSLGPITTPSDAYILRVSLEGDGQVLASSYNLWFSRPQVKRIVNNAQLDSDIDAAKLTTGTLPTARIAALSIADSQIGSVSGAKLTANTVPQTALQPITDPSRLVIGIDPSTPLQFADLLANIILQMYYSSGAHKSVLLPAGSATGVQMKGSGTALVDVDSNTTTLSGNNVAINGTTDIFGATNITDPAFLGQRGITSSVQATTVAETIIASFTQPANSLVVGRVYSLLLRGRVGSELATRTVNLRLRLNGTGGTQVINLPFSIPAGSSNSKWQSQIDFTCRSLGSSGTIWGGGNGILGAVSSVVDGQNTALTLNTTTSNTLDITAAWSAANAANIWTIDQAWIEQSR